MSDSKTGSRWASVLLTIPEYPLLINTPRRKIFKGLIIIWSMLFIGALFSVGLFWFISIPLFVINGYIFFVYEKIWRLHRYSGVILWGLMLTAVVLFFKAAPSVRGFLLHLSQGIFR